MKEIDGKTHNFIFNDTFVRFNKCKNFFGGKKVKIDNLKNNSYIKMIK